MVPFISTSDIDLSRLYLHFTFAKLPWVLFVSYLRIGNHFKLHIVKLLQTWLSETEGPSGLSSYYYRYKLVVFLCSQLAAS